MSSSAGRPAEIVVIGETERGLWSRLLRQLAVRSDCVITAEFDTLQQAFAAGLGESLSPDVVLVLQSWSDQYSREDVDTLIGRMLFSRILCSYGPWCESDGRTRNYWPVALRIESRLTESVLDLELRRFHSGYPSLLPTAAAEELFLDRCQVSTSESAGLTLKATYPELRSVSILAVSSDRLLRETWTMACQSMGMIADHCGLLTEQSGHPVNSRNASPDIVVHDLDPGLDFTGESVQQARRQFPRAALFGVATIPEACSEQRISDAGLRGIIPKLDLIHGLSRHLLLAVTSGKR